MKRLIAGVLAALPLLGVVANATAVQPEIETTGRTLYLQQCGGCHLEGGFATRVLARRVPAGQAELEHREDLPRAFVVAAVRRGIGSMPQMRPAELNDADLAEIARYLDKAS